MTDLPTRETQPGVRAGSRLGRYHVLEKIGHGGMGEVYLARDTLLDRRVALKCVSPRLSHQAFYRRRLLREAQRAGRVSDSRIAAVYDVLDISGEVVLVMEYVTGRTLRKVLDGPVALERFWDIAVRIAGGLEVAHAQGLAHLDMKPENVMITDSGGVKILDFGVAKKVVWEDPEETRTRTEIGPETPVGTAHYMAPEVGRGEIHDQRADVFSLGVMFYEMLAGFRPFEGRTALDLGEQIARHDPESLHNVREDVPRSLSNVVARAISKKPGDRHAAAGELLADLEAVRGGASAGAPKPTTGRPGRIVGIPRPLLLALVGAAAAFLVWMAAGAPALRQLLGGSRLPDKKFVAVLPMQIASDDTDLEAFGMGLSEMLTEGLRRMTDRGDLQVGALPEMIDERIETPEQAGKTFGANLAVRAVLSEDGTNLVANLTLFDTFANSRLRTGKAEHDASEPLEFARLTFQSVAELLGVGLGDAESRRWIEPGTEGEGTFRFFARGLGRLEVAGDLADVQSAIDELELARKTDPMMATAHAALAMAQLEAHSRSGDSTWLGRAEGSVRRAAAIDPARWEVNAARGFVYTRKSLTDARNRITWSDSAVVAFEKSLDENPLNDEVLQQLARVHGRIGRHDREEAVYRRASERRPHYWRPYWWLAAFHYRHGRLDDALQAFRRMAEAAPLYYKAHSNLGGLYVLEGRYAEGIESLTRSIDILPTGAALSNLGTAYFLRRNFEDAIKTYNQAIQYDFATYEIWANLGDAYYWAPGMASSADDVYRQAVGLGLEELAGRPYDVTIRAHLAPIYPKIGRPDSARASIEAALSEEPDNPVIQHAAALTYWQLDLKDEAFDWLQRAVEGGYPTRWIEDSIVFDSWRDDDRYRIIMSREMSSQANPEAEGRSAMRG